MNKTAHSTAWLLGALVAIAIMLFLSYRGSIREAPDTEADNGRAAPELTFVDLDGNPGKLSDYAGKIVLVNFWASWCPPCRKEMPALVHIHNEYESKGVAVLGVAMDAGGLHGVRRFLQETAVTYPVVIPNASSSTISSVRGLPTTWLIDKNGRIDSVYAGAMTEDVFRQGVERLLAEPAGVPDGCRRRRGDAPSPSTRS